MSSSEKANRLIDSKRLLDESNNPKNRLIDTLKLVLESINRDFLMRFPHSGEMAVKRVRLSENAPR
jgi:hypothetical protein